jgi:thioredoxin 1
MANIIEATNENFDQIINGDKPVLVSFWAEWAGPCRMIAPILEEMSEEYDKTAVIVKVNVDENPKLSMKYGIRSIPALFYFKDGQIVDKVIGAQGKSVISGKLSQLV